MYIFGIIAISSAISVVLLSRMVYSIAMVLVFFIATAAILIGMYAEYLALITIMVYAGAIMVLYLFAMIMFRQENSRVVKTMSQISMPLILTIAIILTIIWGTMITGVISGDAIDSEQASGALTVANFSESLFGALLVPFEIVSIVLLVAMMGAILISSKMNKAASKSGNTKGKRPRSGGSGGVKGRNLNPNGQHGSGIGDIHKQDMGSLISK